MSSGSIGVTNVALTRRTISWVILSPSCSASSSSRAKPLESDAGAVLTDSGGIQEETTYLGIPCFTLRDNTERPVTIRAGTNTLLGLDPERITEIPGRLSDRVGSSDRAKNPQSPDLWDGHAAERVAEVLADW